MFTNTYQTLSAGAEILLHHILSILQSLSRPARSAVLAILRKPAVATEHTLEYTMTLHVIHRALTVFLEALQALPLLHRLLPHLLAIFLHQVFLRLQRRPRQLQLHKQGLSSYLQWVRINLLVAIPKQQLAELSVVKPMLMIQ